MRPPGRRDSPPSAPGSADPTPAARGLPSSRPHPFRGLPLHRTSRTVKIMIAAALALSLAMPAVVLGRREADGDDRRRREGHAVVRVAARQGQPQQRRDHLLLPVRPDGALRRADRADRGGRRQRRRQRRRRRRRPRARDDLPLPARRANRLGLTRGADAPSRPSGSRSACRSPRRPTRCRSASRPCSPAPSAAPATPAARSCCRATRSPTRRASSR